MMKVFHSVVPVLAFVGVVALGVGVLAGAGEEEAVELPHETLVFTGHSDAARKDYDVWRVCPDGTQLASLVVLPGHQHQVVVSPDGNELIYTDPVDGANDLWHRPFGGGEAVNLTAHPARDSSPTWSPDGAEVAFFSDREAERPELYVLTLATGALRRLTENTYYDSGASWSPDGARILFTRYFPEDSTRAGHGEIVALEVATGAERVLTDLGGYNGSPDHSPDGARVVFHRTTEEGSELWMMAADGTAARALTESYLDEYSPVWSPDAAWIAYTAGKEHDGMGTFDLWLMRADGTERQVVAALANTQQAPQWRGGGGMCY